MPEGLDTPDLECVMLNLGPLSVQIPFGAAWDPTELYYGKTPKLKYAQGAVAEQSAHVTLLFGIHPSDTYVDDVMNALGDWEPQDVLIQDVGYFPSNVEGEDYTVIIGRIIPTANLLLARRRLEKLPYTDQFASEYKPHVTLAYIKGSKPKRIARWVNTLNAYYRSQILTPTELDLGLEVLEDFSD
jgi:2'-5' RNA ligase